MSGAYGEFLHYPNAGGLYEQDWKLIAIFQIIQPLVKEHIRQEIRNMTRGT